METREAQVIATGEKVTVYRHQPTGGWVSTKDYFTIYSSKDLRFY